MRSEFLAALMGLLAPAAWAGGVADRVAAVVEEEVIALSEVYDLGGPHIAQTCGGREACAHELELQVLDALIKRALIRNELERLDLKLGGADVDRAIDQTVRDNGLEDRQQLRAEVEASGLRWDAYREELLQILRTQAFQARVLAPRVSVADDEVRDLYQRTVRKGAQLEVRLQALGIAIPEDVDEETAASMLEQAAALVAAINADELTWEDAVAQYDGAGLSQAIGDRAYRKGQLMPAIDALVFDAPVGIAQAPVQVGPVLIVVRVVDRGLGDAGVQPLEDVESDLRNQLFQRKLEEAEEEWYQRARRESSVQVLLEREEE